MAAEGKPEKSGTKSSQVKWTASCLTTLKLTKHTHFLHKSTSWMTARQFEAYLESVNASVVEFARFEVGEGIEKAANDFEAEVAATMAAALNN